VFNIKTRFTAAALTAAALAVPAALSASPADASVGSMSARLSVTRNYQRYSVDVKGLIRMTPTEAQNMINSGYRVSWKLYGSDPIWDDFLFGPDPAGLNATTQGLAFEGTRVTTGSMLDEDDSWTDEHDELYAAVKLTAPNGSTVRSAHSNEVGGYW
jgi:hypothetical protein